MTPIEQLKQLITAYADNLAAQERVLRQLYRVVERITEPATSSKAAGDILMRICHSGEEHFIPLTKKDSTGIQFGVNCDNSWGLTANASTCLVKYPSDSIESITKEIHKKD